MLFCFLYSLFCRVTLAAGLWIEDHYDDPLDIWTDDEGVSAGGVISPAVGSLLPAHVVCHGKFNLVVVFFLFCLSTPVTIWLIVVLYCVFYILLKSLLNCQISHQPFGHAWICFNFCEGILSNPCQGRFNIPKSFVDSLPPPPISCILKTHWKLIEYHMSAA